MITRGIIDKYVHFIPPTGTRHEVVGLHLTATGVGLRSIEDMQRRFICDVNRKRAVQLCMRMQLVPCVDESLRRHIRSTRHLGLIISPKRTADGGGGKGSADGDNLKQIKSLGELCLAKVYFGLQVLYEILSDDARESGGRAGGEAVQFKNIQVKNIVVRWHVNPARLRPFRAYSREFKNICKTHGVKIPQMYINLMGRTVVILSTNGKAIAAGLASLDELDVIQEHLEWILSTMERKSSEYMPQLSDSTIDHHSESHLWNCFCSPKHPSQCFNISSVRFRTDSFKSRMNTHASSGHCNSLDYTLSYVRNLCDRYGVDSPQIDVYLGITERM